MDTHPIPIVESLIWNWSRWEPNQQTHIYTRTYQWEAANSWRIRDAWIHEEGWLLHHMSDCIARIIVWAPWHVRTPVVNAIIIWPKILWWTHVTERDHPRRREEEGTEGHQISLWNLNIRPHVISAAIVEVIARECKCYRPFFFSVGIFFDSLQFIELIGHSSVLSGANTLSKEFGECCILTASECTS